MAISFDWTDDVMQYVNEHINDMSYIEMAKHVSKMMGREIKPDTLGNHCRRCGIKRNSRIFKDGRITTEFRFNEEHIEFIKNIFDDEKTTVDIAKEFNEHFGTNITRHNIKGQLKKHNIRQKQNKLRTFRRGNHPFALPIGTERIGSGGVMCVKVSDDELPSGCTRNWIPKGRYVYEKHHGKINRKDHVIHLDGDSSNFDIDNLECVSPEETACMARNRLFLKDKELTKTGVMIAKLQCLLK